MRDYIIRIDVDPRDLRSYRRLDIALNDLSKKIIDAAAEAHSTTRITVKLTVEDTRVPA